MRCERRRLRRRIASRPVLPPLLRRRTGLGYSLIVAPTKVMKREQRRAPGYGLGAVSLAQWDRARIQGKDRGRITALSDPDRNDDTPDEVSYGSGKRRWFRCAEGHPPWQARINDMTASRTGCPYCAGHRVAVGMNDLATTHPDLAREWHASRNRDLTAQQVTAGSNRRVWWCCLACGFEWDATVHDRTTSGTGCPHCLHHRALPGVDDLSTTHPQLIREWDRRRNLPLAPTQVTAGSKYSVWWRCARCRHAWRTAIQYRATLGTGCPACAGKVVLPGRSFGDLVVVRDGEWSKLNELAPWDYAPQSHRRVWRRCLRCGVDFQQTAGNWASGRSHRCARTLRP